ncbi:MAG: NAD(P)-binding protein [bacterium]|nr:NAD(P)-binding protein [bacterium]
MEDSRSPFQIAVIGAGAAGVTAANILQRRHNVTLFEKNSRLGGHVNTIEIENGPDAGTAVDTGFIVFNDRTYPLFNRLLSQLEVTARPSDMSFGFHDEASDFYYAGMGWRNLLARKRNALSPSFWSLLIGIDRFGREGRRALKEENLEGVSLGEFVIQKQFSPFVIQNYIAPMAAAIWSTPAERVLEFPAGALLSFYENHGLLNLSEVPCWRTVTGGSREYIRAFVTRFQGRIVTGAKIERVERGEQGVTLRFQGGEPQRFDKVVMAAHADESLALLADPSPDERRLLGAWRYEKNLAILHTDASVMPARRAAWASWNYTREKGPGAHGAATLTYWMNRLQGLKTRDPYFVTLNRFGAIDESKVIRRIEYSHPGYTFQSIASQRELPSLNGINHTYFCGSYFSHGFHEDAVRAGAGVAHCFGLEL